MDRTDAPHNAPSRLVGEHGHAADALRPGLRLFTRFSQTARGLAGSPLATAAVLLAIVVWVAIGPFVDFSTAWELTGTAGTPMVALVLLVVLQHSQNQDDRATQLKLNEVIRATENASDRMIGIEQSAEDDLRRLLVEYRRHAGMDADTGADRPRSGGRRRARQRPVPGDLGPDRGFVFQLPEGGSRTAHDLARFTWLAGEVDDHTWLYHLRRGDFARWFDEAVNDPVLAAEARTLVDRHEVPAHRSRKRITTLIERRCRLAG